MNALAAVDDLYIRRGLGPANAARADLTTSAPKALRTRAAVRFLRAVDGCPSPRDRAIALVPFYAGARIRRDRRPRHRRRPPVVDGRGLALERGLQVAAVVADRPVARVLGVQRVAVVFGVREPREELADLGGVRGAQRQRAEVG